MKRVFAWIVIFLIPLIIVLTRSYALPLVSAKTASNKEMQNQGELTIIIEEKETVTSAVVNTETIRTIRIKGNREVRYTHEKRIIKMLDTVEESKQVSIRKDGRLIYYDPETEIGYEMKDPSEPLRELTEKQKEGLANGITDAFGAKTRIIGEEKIAGKPCVITVTVTDRGGIKTVDSVWTWTLGGEKYVLKSHHKGMGTVIRKIATLVKVGMPIDDADFLVPYGTKIKPFKY